MKILIIGGTYFLGREFARIAGEKKENEIFFLNRGSRLSELPEDIKNKTIVADRHDVSKIREIDHGYFDVVVDFCAYSAGDIRTVAENLSSCFGQYIFISTTDVYKRGSGKVITEEADFETVDYGGEAGGYILGKVALEKEIKELSADSDHNYTVIRPAFIYGPDNYAPREGIYFNWIIRAGQILSPADSDGFFQMSYVSDVAKVIYKCCMNKAAYNEAFNVCCEEKETYKSFENSLEEASQKVFGKDFVKVDLSVKDVEEKGIMLPFPLKKEESEYYSNTKVKEILGAEFIPLNEGLVYTAKEYLS